jgi:hypothetical protein
MCGNCGNEYNPFPTISIGGPPGDYAIQPPVPSNLIIEYKVIAVSSIGVNPGVIQVSGVREPKSLDTTGNSTYNGVNPNASIRSLVIPIGPNGFLPVLSDWEQIASPNGHLFVRIDGVIAAFVSIKQRVKILSVVPAPFVTVDPQQPHDMNLAREQQILQAVYGTPGREIEYGHEPIKSGTVRDLATNGTIDSGTRSWWGRPKTRGAD